MKCPKMFEGHDLRRIDAEDAKAFECIEDRCAYWIKGKQVSRCAIRHQALMIEEISATLEFM